MSQHKATITIDGREKVGWTFPANDWCVGSVYKPLKTGDYSLLGIENLFCIERKGTIAEFAQNIVQARWDKELQRLEEFDSAFIILEFDVETILRFPYSSDIPRYKWPHIKIKPEFIMKKILDYMTNYKTKVILAGTEGRRIATGLMKRAALKYADKLN